MQKDTNLCSRVEQNQVYQEVISKLIAIGREQDAG